eukprot:scaffold731_cov261-Pinguiococcus_pyrenoidosus.AAC.113
MRSSSLAAILSLTAFTDRLYSSKTLSRPAVVFCIRSFWRFCSTSNRRRYSLFASQTPIVSIRPPPFATRSAWAIRTCLCGDPPRLPAASAFPGADEARRSPCERALDVPLPAACARSPASALSRALALQPLLPGDQSQGTASAPPSAAAASAPRNHSRRRCTSAASPAVAAAGFPRPLSIFAWPRQAASRLPAPPPAVSPSCLASPALGAPGPGRAALPALSPAAFSGALLPPPRASAACSSSSTGRSRGAAGRSPAASSLRQRSCPSWAWCPAR